MTDLEIATARAAVLSTLATALDSGAGETLRAAAVDAIAALPESDATRVLGHITTCIVASRQVVAIEAAKAAAEVAALTPPEGGE